MVRKTLYHVLIIIALGLGGGFFPGPGDARGGLPVVVDEGGRRIVVKHPFKKIISLYGAHTENLFQLGLNNEIVGISRSDRLLPQARGKAVFSYHDGPERFLAAGPDLVLIRPMIDRGYKDLVRKLEEMGIVVVSLQPRTAREMYSYWMKLGILTGRAREAEKMIHDFREVLVKISGPVKMIPRERRKRVYFESIHSKMKTFSPESIAIFCLESAGGINVASDARAVRHTNIAFYGKERILAHAEEIDVYLAQRGPMNHVTREMILHEPGFQAIKAVRQGKVYIIDEKLVSRPTVRLLQGIKLIRGYLYPPGY